MAKCVLCNRLSNKLLLLVRTARYKPKVSDKSSVTNCIFLKQLLKFSVFTGIMQGHDILMNGAEQTSIMSVQWSMN